MLSYQQMSLYIIYCSKIYQIKPRTYHAWDNFSSIQLHCVALNLPDVRLQTCRKNRWNDLFKQVEKSSFSLTFILFFIILSLHPEHVLSIRSSKKSWDFFVFHLLNLHQKNPSKNTSHDMSDVKAKSLWPNESEWSSPGTYRSECPPPPATRLTSRRRVPHPNCWRSHAQQIPRSGPRGRDPVRPGPECLRWLSQPGWLSGIVFEWFLDACCKASILKWLNGFGIWAKYDSVPKPGPWFGAFWAEGFPSLRSEPKEIPCLQVALHYELVFSKVHCF